jgi:D-alanyl-D-alanine carboxypeptidase (penicillin-binding protein 5/6)
MFFRRVFATVVITFTLFLQLLTVPLSKAEASELLETNAVSAVLMEANTGKILYSKEPHKRVAPASVTKVMTLLVAIEAIAKGKVAWDDRVIASEEAWKLGGSQIWLEPGEEFSLKEMLIAIAVGSANDACVAVAEHIAGSHEAFVHLMNQKANSLGLKNTHFANAYGLPAEGHYTSAYDMAQICRECLKYPELLELTSIKHYDKLRGGRPKLDNTNKLLWWYEGTDGFKTGWTSEAKYCLASTVKRDGLRLICCVFGVPEPRGHFRESMKLYNWGFANYAFKKVASPEQVITTVLLAKGEEDRIKVGVAREAGVVVKKGEEAEVKTQVKLPASVIAPVRKGEVLGELIILADGKTVEKVPLVAQETIPKASFWLLFKKLLRFFIV